MLHAVTACVAAIAVLAGAGCVTEDDPSFVSTSRMTLGERQTATVFVGVESLADLDITPPDGVTVDPFDDGVQIGLTITASCDAARGMDMVRAIEVIDRKTDRSASIVLEITDDATCLVDIAIWEEACVGACDAACGSPPDVLPALISIPRAESRRICARAMALDSARPLVAGGLALEPSTSAFQLGMNDTELKVVIKGTDWLVGPYEAVWSGRAGGEFVTARTSIEIGMPGDIGVELVLPATAPELARTSIPVTIHHFPGTPCVIRVSPAVSFVDPKFAARLYDSNGDSTGTEIGDPSLACSDSHTSMTFVVVPTVDAFATILPRLIVGDLAAGGQSINAPLLVTSRVEDVPAVSECPQQPTRLACADLDADGALEVVLGDGSGKFCMASLDGMRFPSTVFDISDLAGPQILHLLSTSGSTGPRVYGVDTAGALYQLKLSGGARSWNLAVTSALPMGSRAFAMAADPTQHATHIVGITGATQLRFTALDNSNVGTATITMLRGNSIVGVGSTRSSTGGPDLLVIVGGAWSVIGEYTVELFAVDWSKAVDGDPPGLTSVGIVEYLTTDGLPQSATVEVASRLNPAELIQHDLLISFRSGPYENAVAEIQGLSRITEIGGVRSIASAPDGTALLGAASGARSTARGLDGLVTYRPIDPAPIASPTYGDVITPCYGGQNELAAFAVTVGSQVNALARVSLMNVIAEIP